MRKRTDFLLVDCGRWRNLQKKAIQICVHGWIMETFRSNA